MGTDNQPANIQVDLKFAKAYVPICIVSVQYALIIMFQIMAPVSEIHSWGFILIALWFMKRTLRDIILNHNSLLETIVLTGMFMHYRNTYQTHEVFERVTTILWVLAYLCANIPFMSTNYRLKTRAHTYVVWFLYFILTLVSLHCSFKDNIPHSHIIKGGLFLTASIGWVYICDTDALRYDRIHQCEQCKLFFLSMLMTPVLYSVGMFVLLVVEKVYVSISKSQYTYDTTDMMERGEKVQVLYSDKLSDPNITPDDEEFIRLAKGATGSDTVKKE